MVYKYFDKNLSGSGVKSGNMLKQEFAEELQKPILRKLKKQKYTHLLQIIFGVLILLIFN